jgi:DNA repair protein REV1
MKTNAVAELPLYGAWAKAKDKEIMDLTGDNTGEMIGDHNVSEVIELGIDPSVFRELPADLQQEIVAEERGKARKRKILNLPADISRAQARERDRDVGRTASLSPTRSSRAGSAAPVNRLTVSRPAKPVLLKATSLSDVLETMTRWIDSRKGAGPAARDANKVKAYLVKCMAPEAGMGGPENAIEVLRWMRSLLEEIWGRGEVMEDTAGKEWWDTWDGFREQVNRISLERFGAGIRLET